MAACVHSVLNNVLLHAIVHAHNSPTLPTPTWGRSLMPGWSTLTWTTLNIDVFQYRVQATTASLRALVDSTHHILEASVNRALQRIKETSLFDATLASAHPWVITLSQQVSFFFLFIYVYPFYVVVFLLVHLSI